MGDQLRGDIDVEVGGDIFTLRFGGSGLMAIEQAFGGESFQTVLRRLNTADRNGAPVLISDVARIAHGGFRHHHPDMTLDEAADLAFMPDVQVAIGEAIAAAFPNEEAGADAAADPTPTKRKAPGTGTTRSHAGTRPAVT